MRLRTAILLGGSTLLLSACGLRGDLERPAPLWGDPAAATGDASEEEPVDPNAPVPIDRPGAR